MDPEETAPTGTSDPGRHCLSKRLQTFHQTTAHTTFL